MATVLLGNKSPIVTPPGTSVVVNGQAPEQAVPDVPKQTIVIIDTPELDVEGNAIPLGKRLTEIRNAFRTHSDAEAAWVEGHDDFFTKAVAQEFSCPIGRPSDWDTEPVVQPANEQTAQTVSQVDVEVKEESPQTESAQ